MDRDHLKRAGASALCRFIGSAVLALALLLPFASCSGRIGVDSKVYVVGIACNYGTGSYSHLSATCRDAEEFCLYYKRILDTKGIENKVFLMLDSREEGDDGANHTDRSSPYAPSIANIRALFGKFVSGSEDEGFDKLDDNDMLVVYYSGHGITPSGKDYTDQNVGAFILPDYGQSPYPSQQRYGILTNSEFASMIEALPCQVAIICDSCYSGHMAGVLSDGGESVSGSEYEIGKEDVWRNDFSRLSALSNASGVFASPAAEQSYADDGGTIGDFNGEAHSLFTGFFLERAMGWTHEDGVWFAAVPSSASSEGGVFSSLSSRTSVYGRGASEKDMRGMRLSLADIASSFGAFGMVDGRVSYHQRPVITTGLTTKLLLW